MFDHRNLLDNYIVINASKGEVRRNEYFNNWANVTALGKNGVW